jgi:tetratricopeptide (TPR) repeat protein
MNQRYLLSGQPMLNLDSFLAFGQSRKIWLCTFYVFLIAGLLTPPKVIALETLDITEQIHHSSVNNSEGRNFREEADKLLMLSREQSLSGHPDKMIESGLQALDLYHRIGDLKSQGLTYDSLASAYIQLSDFKSAEDSMRRRIAIARDNQDFQTEIFALNNLATLLLRKGENSSAEKTIRDAILIARNIKNIEGQGLSYSNFCLVATRLEEYTQAIKLCEKALIFRRQTNDAIGEANTLNNLGDAYLAVKDYQNTIGTYGAAMQLAKISFDRPNQLRAIDGLITAHSAVKRYERSLELLAERLAIDNFLKNPREELKYLRISAEIYEKMGNYAKARNFYQQAVSLSQNLDDIKQEALFTYKLQELQKR